MFALWEVVDEWRCTVVHQFCALRFRNVEHASLSF